MLAIQIKNLDKWNIKTHGQMKADLPEMSCI